MKVVIGITVALALLGPVLAWMFIDGPTALLFAIGSLVVCVCAAMPVLFSVLTRRKLSRKRAETDAELIRAIQPTRDSTPPR